MLSTAYDKDPSRLVVHNRSYHPLGLLVHLNFKQIPQVTAESTIEIGL